MLVLKKFKKSFPLFIIRNKPSTLTAMESVAPPRSGEVKVYVPESSGPSWSVTSSPELVSLILGLLGDIVYPLGAEGAKFDMVCGAEPFIDTEPKVVKVS